MFFDIPYTNTCDVGIFCEGPRQEAVLRFTVQNNGPARESYRRSVGIANRTAQDRAQGMKSSPLCAVVQVISLKRRAKDFFTPRGG